MKKKYNMNDELREKVRMFAVGVLGFCVFRIFA